MKCYQLIVVIIALPIIINWGNEGGTTTNNLHFYGELTRYHENIDTAEKKMLEVHDILFHPGKKNKQIPMYDKPTDLSTVSEKEGEIALPVKPRTAYTETYIDLSETSIIRCILNRIYIYKEADGHGTIKYVELEIVSNAQPATTRSYLVEESAYITCNEHDQAGPIEKKVPIIDIKELKIIGVETPPPSTPAPSSSVNPLTLKLQRTGTSEDKAPITAPATSSTTQPMSPSPAPTPAATSK